MKHPALEIIILGSGTCIPSKTRGPSGIILQSPEFTILLDGGSGTLAKMTQLSIDYKSLNFIFYTHFHPDHCIDLVPILQALKLSPGELNNHRLQIIGPDGLMEFIDNLSLSFGTWIKDGFGVVLYHEMNNTSSDYGFGTVTCLPMKHSSSSNGYRFNLYDKQIVYSGDTDYCEQIIDLARHADVLILECSTPDDGKLEGHLTPTLAAKIAQQADCAHLILTHFYPSIEHIDILPIIRNIYRGKVTLAYDSMTLKF